MASLVLELRRTRAQQTPRQIKTSSRFIQDSLSSDKTIPARSGATSPRLARASRTSRKGEGGGLISGADQPPFLTSTAGGKSLRRISVHSRDKPRERRFRGEKANNNGRYEGGVVLSQPLFVVCWEPVIRMAERWPPSWYRLGDSRRRA